MTGTIKLSQLLGMASVDAAMREGCETVADVIPFKRDGKDYQALVESMRADGVHTPILITDGCVCNGMHRVAAAQELGLTELPWTDDFSLGYSGEDAA